MRAHLTLLDHSVLSVAEALRSYRVEDRKPDDKRDAFRLSLALQHAHLAVEKLLKHSISTVDPYLLLEQANVKFLRDLRKELLQQNLPSIFASRRYLASSNAEQAWDVITEVLSPPIPPTSASAFKSALKVLTLLRNQTQHGEFYTDTTEVLSALERIFARLPEVAEALCPDFLKLLEERHPHQYAELRAIEAAVDAAWWTLREYLKKGRRVTIPISVYVTTRPNIPTVSLSISRDQPEKYPFLSKPKPGESSLTVFAEIEPDRVSGLFARAITAEEAKERDQARREVVRRRLARVAPQPAIISLPEVHAATVGGLLSNLGIGDVASSPRPGSLLRKALETRFEEERTYIEKYGVPALEDGEIELESATAWITAPLARRSSSHVTGDVLLANCKLALQRRKPRGRFSGLLFPRKGTESVEPILISGKVWLTYELVVEANASDTHPLGSVIRYLKGDVKLLLSQPPEKS